MKDHTACLEAINRAFVEVTLAVGYVLSTIAISDDLIWSLIRQLDVIHEDACRQCRNHSVATGENADDDGHPAIVHLLELLRCRGIAIQVEGQPSKGKK